MKKLNVFTALVALYIATGLSAQETGMIKGTITDEKGANMPMVTVALLEDSTLISAISTDNNGDFTFKLLTPGWYNLQFTFVGYHIKKVDGVQVSPNKTSYVYKSLNLESTLLGKAEVFADVWVKPIVDVEFSSIQTISIDKIERSAAGSSDLIGMITSFSTDVQPADNGKDLYMRGSRTGSNGYYIDGNRVVGTGNVPGLGIAEIIVLTGGVPAEYGDCTGGLVIITTKDYKTEMRRKEMARRQRIVKEEAKFVPAY